MSRRLWSGSAKVFPLLGNVNCLASLLIQRKASEHQTTHTVCSARQGPPLMREKRLAHNTGRRPAKRTWGQIFLWHQGWTRAIDTVTVTRKAHIVYTWECTRRATWPSSSRKAVVWGLWENVNVKIAFFFIRSASRLASLVPSVCTPSYMRQKQTNCWRTTKI